MPLDLLNRDLALGSTKTSQSREACEPGSVSCRISLAEREIGLVAQHPNTARMESLINCTTELVGAVRDMNTSWAVERTQLIKKVDEIGQQLNKLVATQEHFEEKVEDIERFIQGDGKDHHIGQRLHGMDILIQQMQEHAKESKRHSDNQFRKLETFQNRLMWGIVGVSLAASSSLAWHLIDMIGKKG